MADAVAICAASVAASYRCLSRGLTSVKQKVHANLIGWCKRANALICRPEESTACNGSMVESRARTLDTVWHSRRAGLAMLILCLVLSLGRPYHPIYDGAPNNGDETMSLAQAMNTFRLGSPGYGYTRDGSPWTPGWLVLPGYFMVYGPLMTIAPPLARLPAARLCSRVVFGVALFLCLLLLWRTGTRLPARTGFDRVALALLAAGLVWLFTASQAFLGVASSGRVDALGMLSVCVFQLLAARFLEKPTGRRLVGLGVMVVAASSCSFLAGVLCASEATVLGLWYLLVPFRRGKAVEVLRALGIVLGVSTAVAVPILFVILRHPVVSTPNVTLNKELAIVSARAANLISVGAWEVLWRFPGLGASAAYVLAGALAFGIAGSRKCCALTILRLIATVITAAVFCAFPRACYAPLLILAVLLPFLNQLLSFGSHRGLKWLLVPAFPVLVAASVVGPWPDPSADARRQDINIVRDSHIRMVTAFLDREGANAILATDPMFTLLDDKTRKYYFIYETDLTGNMEQQVVERFVKRLGARYLVTTEFGSRGWVSSIGMPTINEFTSKHSSLPTAFEVRYPSGEGFRLSRIFVSKLSGVEPGVEYQYGDRSSTPISVFRIDPLIKFASHSTAAAWR